MLKNKKSFICFPLYPPLELLHSFGFLPETLWTFHEQFNTTAESDKHVQDFACGIARQLTHFLLSTPEKEISGLLTYNACDTLRNLPEIIQYGVQAKNSSLPWFKMHIPMRPFDQEYVENYLKQEIDQLIEKIMFHYDISFSIKSFKQSVEVFRTYRNLMEKVEDLIAQGKALFSDYIQLLFKDFPVSLSEKIDALEDFYEIHRNKEPLSLNPGKKRIAISGILSPPIEIIREMEQNNLRIVTNDLACLKRANAYTPSSENFTTPADYYYLFYKHHFPCTTLLYTAEDRFNRLEKLFQEKSIHGLIFIGEKFCEYEYFEIPSMENYFKSQGYKTLNLEISQDTRQNQSFQSIKTRIETFSEILQK